MKLFRVEIPNGKSSKREAKEHTEGLLEVYN